jgi:protein-arginine kinase activator protein McsA
MSMKSVGICEQCSKGGALETIEVTKVGTSAPVVNLLLCRRCAVQPNAVWRRRYKPVERAQHRAS